MKEEILSAVVEVEKEISINLESERTRARNQLDKFRSDAEKEVLKEKASLQAELDERVSRSRMSAEKQASEIVAMAEASASRLDNLDDDKLKAIIKRHITGLLP